MGLPELPWFESAVTPTGRLESALGEMIRRLADPLLAAALDPAYQAEMAVGFVRGFCDGVAHQAGVWLSDLARFFVALQKGVAFLDAQEEPVLAFAVLTAVSVQEFLRRPMPAPNKTQSLSPRTREILESLSLFHALHPLATWLQTVEEVLGAIDLLDVCGLVAEDLIQSVSAAGLEWMCQFQKLTGNPIEQGRHLGRAMGEATVLLIRAIVEPTEDVIAYVAAGLIVTDDELRAMGVHLP